MKIFSVKNKKLFFLFFSYLLSPLFYLKIIFRKKKKGEPKKFLVIDTAKIGDMVSSTPVFRAIKTRFPNNYLAVLVTSQVEGILENNPYIDEIILIDEFKGIKQSLKLIKLIKNKNFDWSFKLTAGGWEDIIAFWAGIPNRVTAVSRHSGKISNLLSIFNNFRKEYTFNELKSRFNLNLLKILGINESKDKREAFYTQKELAKITEIFEKNGIHERDFLIGISVTAGNKFKEWEPEKFSQLADRLIKELKAKILFLGSKEDQKTVAEVILEMEEKVVNLSGLISLKELPALINKLDLFISVDTGPLYIAAALDVLVVDINGPFNVREQMLPTTKAEIIENKIYCQPCSHLVDAKHFCKEGHRECVKGITVDMVFQGIERLIKKYNLK